MRRVPKTSSLSSVAEPAAAEARAPVASEDASTAIKILYLALWAAASSLIILANKQILSEEKFEYPNALSAMGMVFSGVVSFLLCSLGIVPMGPLPTLRFYCMRVLPIGLAMASTMFFGNYAYLFLSVSFVQILKAFTPVATMLGLFMTGLEKPSWGLCLSTLMIAVGTAIASIAETHWHWVGFLSFMLSMIFEAVRLILIQVLVGSFSFNAIEALVYMAPACLLFLGAGAAVYEWEGLTAPGGGFDSIRAKPMLYLATASLGFLVNLFTFLVIQTASSLTLKVVGCIKNALIVYLGVIVYGNEVNPMQLGGYGMSLMGFVLYNQAASAARRRDAAAAAAKGGRATGEDATGEDGGGLEGRNNKED